MILGVTVGEQNLQERTPTKGRESLRDMPECETASAETSQQYGAAIALLRSWRNVSKDEQREQCETWELLEQALGEDRYY